MKNKSKEAVSYFNKFMLNQKFSIPENGHSYEKLLVAMEKIIPFEAPDFYSIVGNTIYIFEHFEFDSSPNTRKGSQNRIEINKDIKKFKESFCNNPNADGTEIYKGELIVKQSITNYMKNLASAFENHYQKIKHYKENILEHINCDNDKKFDFVVTFLIEDVSIFGSIYFDKESKLLLPIFVKEFVDLWKKKLNVDNIICSAETNENKKNTYIVSKNDFVYLNRMSIPMEQIKQFGFNPKSIWMRIITPFK